MLLLPLLVWGVSSQFASAGEATSPDSLPESIPASLSESHAVFGGRTSVSYGLAPVDPTFENLPPTAVGPQQTTDWVGFSGMLSTMLFGKDRSILETRAGMTDLLEGESDLYWGGFRVFSSKPAFIDGSYQISAGLPSLSMRIPLFGVPVGPVTVRIDAGIAAEAAVTAKLTPLIAVPIQFTSVRAEMNPHVDAIGFVEGYAKWIAVRAGVGGSLNLVSANASVSGVLSFGAKAATFAYQGFIGMLAAKIYGFADYFNPFGWKWKRAWQGNFAEWPGKCYSFGPVGGSDPCASFKP